MNINYYKAFLWPPEDLLQHIHFVETNDYWGIDIIPYIATDPGYELYSIAQVEKIRSLWMHRFEFSNHLDKKAIADFKEQNIEQGFTQHSLLAVSELIKNTFEHGNKNKPGSIAHFGYWFNKEGIILGVRDEGSFYANPETTKRIEEKFHFESTKDDPSGHGIEGLYDDSDFLRVVTEQNALFAGFLFKSNLEG